MSPHDGINKRLLRLARPRPPIAHKICGNELKTKVRTSYDDSHGTYGAPCVYQDLNENGEQVARKRAAQEHLIVKAVKVFKRASLRDPALPVANNLLEPDFTATAPNQRWVSDITYICTQEGWLYLGIILDLYSRAIVGSSMDKHMTVALVINALMMAMTRRHISDGLILHSDRGSQYVAKDYQSIQDKHGIQYSMSGTGNCYDNAVVESFFHSLKTECIAR